MEEAIKTLLETGNEALIVFTKRNLLGEEVDTEDLWTLPRVKALLLEGYEFDLLLQFKHVCINRVGRGTRRKARQAVAWMLNNRTMSMHFISR